MTSRQKALIPSILKNQAPILEMLIDRIAEDLDLDSKVMKKKYLTELRSYKKKVSRRKGVINSYAAFLGDKDVENKLREENPEATFGELSKLKGPLWGSLSNEEKDIYKQKAKELTIINLEKMKSENNDVEEEESETINV
jgi:predicted RND superfamily exporter protein